MISNWKLGIHLLLRTKRFGVNNEWWSRFDSIFGYSIFKILTSIFLIYPIYNNYKMIKTRSSLGFVTPEEFDYLFNGK